MNRLLQLLVGVLSLLSTSAFVIQQPTFSKSCGALHVKIGITLGDGEPIDSAIRRFKRECNKSGHLIELRHKLYFENSQEKRKRKIVQARNRRRLERMLKRRTQNQSS